jgi:mannose-1-phosphate guanylyltransferase/mannose-6-phosphate isomerase
VTVQKAGAWSRNLHAVIMAGGKGTRFWPLSRDAFPKQFLKLVGEKTLIQETIHRLENELPAERILVVTTRGQRDIVTWQAREVRGDVQCVVEPEGKNTAPAIALAAFKLLKKNKDALMLVLPADHHIGDPRLFLSTLKKAVPVARKGRLLTFGIKPTRPETGYGYIKAGKGSPDGAYRVERFVEKPDHKTAREYLKDGSYYWNSGMFLFRALDMVQEIERHMPALHRAFAGIQKSLNTKKEEEELAALYPALESQSIDYGVMEKSRKVSMVPAEFPWSDIGSWSALDEVLPVDGSRNVRIGNVVGLGCEDSIMVSSAEKLVAAIGLRDMVVVSTADATLIVPKDRVQEVKDMVSLLKEEGKEKFLMPSIEERPWGWFAILDEGPSFKIKHIYLKPKKKLSLQMHNHRSEHWIVVSGTARVQRGDEVFHVQQNESTFIPATVRHRLENPGIIPLRIVEIQSGEYMGEDDIIRFDDLYGRETG